MAGCEQDTAERDEARAHEGVSAKSEPVTVAP